MVLVKMLMKIDPPKVRGLLEMTMASISPSRREVPKSLRRREKVLLPKFRLETAALHPESPLFIFFLGQKTLHTRRWASKVGQGAHHPPRRAWRGGALVSCGHLEAPLWYLLAPIFLIYSIKKYP